MEKFPPANYSPEMKRSNEQFELQAKARNKEENKKRGWFDRIMSPGSKVSGMDMLQDEAVRVNKLVDERMDMTTSPQSAADDIAESKEFEVGAGERYTSAGVEQVPAKTRIEFEEMLRSKYELIGSMIDHFQIGAAARQAKIAREGMSDAEARSFKDGILGLIQEKIDSAIKANDTLSLKLLFENNDAESLLNWVPADTIAGIPLEILSNPNYKNKAVYVLKNSPLRGRESTFLLLDQLEGRR
ncbi:MAG TPA: hypothetical protein VGB97_03795 [Candidatus Paceibacterota bacterium]|jgi:hypothetical protein